MPHSLKPDTDLLDTRNWPILWAKPIFGFVLASGSKVWVKVSKWNCSGCPTTRKLLLEFLATCGALLQSSVVQEGFGKRMRNGPQRVVGEFPALSTNCGNSCGDLSQAGEYLLNHAQWE